MKTCLKCYLNSYVETFTDSHHLAIFGDHLSIASGDIKYLMYQAT